MTPVPDDRWRAVQDLYEAALARPAGARESFLRDSCPDETLRREVASLLQFAPEGDPLLEKSPFGAPQPGAIVAHYRLQERIGAGGMGEIYRAHDTRLGRELALKLLPASAIAEPSLRARFLREAQSASRLNHPNIVTVYDAGESDGRLFIAMEFVAGKTLDAVIPAAGLPPDELIKLAVPIAGALAKAHGAGIVHRDLKPGNIMLTADRVPKVLDFGLAKLADPTPAPDGPTRTVTQLGMIVGTPEYMSPEQAEGKPVDARSDVFSFGTILYQMATGQRPFRADTPAGAIAAVLHKEPPPIPANIPRDLRKIIERCLRKNPDRRFQAMADLRVALLDVEPDAPAAIASTPSRRARGPRLVAALCVLAAAIAIPWIGRRAPAAPFLQLDLELGDINFPRISPDGLAVAYSEHGQLCYRALNQNQSRKLGGAARASFPFFSPDGRWIAFFSDGKLRKITVTGESLQPICDAPNGRGGAWSADDWIAFAPDMTGGLVRVRASGGTPEPLTGVYAETASANSHRWPAVLPGNAGFLFVAHAPGGLPYAIRAVRAAQKQIQTVVEPASAARYLEGGYLVYVRNTTVYGAAFDSGSLALAGASVPLAEGVYTGTYEGSEFDASPTGTLVYRYDPAMARKLAWLDPAGAFTELDLPPAGYLQPSVAPDGKRIAFTLDREGNRTVWVYDLLRKTMAPVSRDPASQDCPVWTPDSAFLTFRCGDGICLTRPDGGSPLTRWKSKGGLFIPESVTPDGRTLALVHSGSVGQDGEVWLADLTPNGDALTMSDPKPLPEASGGAAISPDGRWRAFLSLESGSREVYVTRFAPGQPPGPKFRISVDGGAFVRWRPGGRLFFRRPGGGFMVTEWSAKGDAFIASPPHPWSPAVVRQLGAISTSDVASDGSRYLVSVDANPPRDPHLHVLLNVTQELARASRAR